MDSGQLEVQAYNGYFEALEASWWFQYVQEVNCWCQEVLEVSSEYIEELEVSKWLSGGAGGKLCVYGGPESRVVSGNQ